MYRAKVMMESSVAHASTSLLGITSVGVDPFHVSVVFVSAIVQGEMWIREVKSFAFADALHGAPQR